MAERGYGLESPGGVAWAVGGLLTALAVWLTRRTAAPTVPVRRPIRESLVRVAYVAVYAILTGTGDELAALGDTAGTGSGAGGHRVRAGDPSRHPDPVAPRAKAWLEGATDTGLARKGVVATLVVFGAIRVGLQTLVARHCVRSLRSISRRSRSARGFSAHGHGLRSKPACARNSSAGCCSVAPRRWFG